MHILAASYRFRVRVYRAIDRGGYPAAHLSLAQVASLAAAASDVCAAVNFVHGELREHNIPMGELRLAATSKAETPDRS